MTKDQHELAKNIQEEINYLKEYVVQDVERRYPPSVIYGKTLLARLDPAKRFQEEVYILYQKYQEVLLHSIEGRIKVLEVEFAALSYTQNDETLISKSLDLWLQGGLKHLEADDLRYRVDKMRELNRNELNRKEDKTMVDWKVLLGHRVLVKASGVDELEEMRVEEVSPGGKVCVGYGTRRRSSLIKGMIGNWREPDFYELVEDLGIETLGDTTTYNER